MGAEKSKLRTTETDEFINGIVDYLQLASKDGHRFRDVLDEFMRTNPAATMIEVAARYPGGCRVRSKIAAKRALVSAYNRQALESFQMRES